MVINQSPQKDDFNASAYIYMLDILKSQPTTMRGVRE